MARSRKPSAELEKKGRYAHNPDRRRVDPPGKGVLSAEPPEHVGLTLEESSAWVEIVSKIPEGLGTDSDSIAVELSARLLVRARSGKCADSTYTVLYNALSRLGMDPQGRMRLAPLAGKKPKAGVVDPLDEVRAAVAQAAGAVGRGDSRAN